MPVQHPLGQYLLGVPRGAGYVGEFDPTGVDYARQAPARRLGIMSQARTEQAEEERLADLAWANAPPTARSPVPPSQITDPAAPALALAEFAPGSELARLGIQYAEGQDPGFGQHIAAGADVLPGGKYLLPLLGSLWGTKKRFLFRGSGPRGSIPVAETGASIRHTGEEILTPGTSYSTDPTVALGFTKIGDISDPMRASPLPPGRFGIHKIQPGRAEKTRNLPPDEYLDLQAETFSRAEKEGGFLESAGRYVETASGMPTSDVNRNTNLYAFPNIVQAPLAEGFSEAEQYLARDVPWDMQNRFERLMRHDLTSPQSEAIRTMYHDPQLSRNIDSPRITERVIEQTRSDMRAQDSMRDFTRRYSQSPFSASDVELSAAIKDVQTILKSPTLAKRVHSRQSLNEFIEWVGNAHGENPKYAPAMQSLRDYSAASANAAKAPSEYLVDIKNEASRKKLRQLHGLEEIARIDAINELQKVAGARSYGDIVRSLEKNASQKIADSDMELVESWMTK